ncbi:Clavaminate synthase-like protein [Pseudovirgaria hyperparasitica]|uniref:Clavaminate synthase-like protein n=1 Tax=Pseudovirgaria hyperparasitica TaxID=470096 RepID=A0A6A6W1T7_9PEZI|nr:Clavaminate synthase-like protein [Pseudovirgaria hyperparasitica]KAF2755964.1 Clavaminate synthase-like protein [Pseudovirgaria hyperparasitica]
MAGQISVIDFGRFIGGSTNERKSVAYDIDKALTTSGFLSLINHGIEQSIIDECFYWSERFFELPVHEKSQLSPSVHKMRHGYLGIGKEIVRGERSHKENFDFGNPEDSDMESWPSPEKLPGFRECAETFYHACSRLISELFECIDLIFKLDTNDSLSKHHSGSADVVSFLHYPAVRQRGNFVRGMAHSDLGTITLLFQHGIGGLQVADHDSTRETTTVAIEKTANFIDVHPDSQAILVNVGYLLMRWTNGRWPSTVHRVTWPPGFRDTQDSGMQTDTPERFSIAFFSFPDYEVDIEPLENCRSQQQPRRWKNSLNAGEYLLKKRRQLYSS